MGYHHHPCPFCIKERLGCYGTNCDPSQPATFACLTCSTDIHSHSWNKDLRLLAKMIIDSVQLPHSVLQCNECLKLSHKQGLYKLQKEEDDFEGYRYMMDERISQ